MTKRQRILASGLIVLSLAGCTSGTTPPPDQTPQALPSTQPTSGVTPIPESAYPTPAPPSPGSQSYPSPSS